MICPKCDHDMEKVEYKDISVDRCSQCHGIWFEVMEHDLLKNMKGSESIDTGDPEHGKLMNLVEKYNCPKCNKGMNPMFDEKKPNLIFEGCGECYGVFFDAGEFTEYKKESILEYIKNLFTKE